MPDQQRVETCAGNYGHTEEDQSAAKEWLELMLNTRVVVPKNKENKQHGGKTDGDRKARSEQYAGNNRQWAHAEVPINVYFSTFIETNSNDCTLDQRAPAN
jgi:hypothetical protein